MENIRIFGDKAPPQFPYHFLRIAEKKEGRERNKKQRIYLEFVKPATDKKWRVFKVGFSPVSKVDRYLIDIRSTFLFASGSPRPLDSKVPSRRRKKERKNRERQLVLCENNYMAFGDGNPSLCFSLS